MPMHIWAWARGLVTRVVLIKEKSEKEITFSVLQAYSDLFDASFRFSAKHLNTTEPIYILQRSSKEKSKKNKYVSKSLFHAEP